MTERKRKPGRPALPKDTEALNTKVLIETMNQVRQIVEQRGMTITAFVGHALTEKIERMKQETRP